MASTKQQYIDAEALFSPVLDKSFYSASIFLLGENHGFADVQKLDLALLRHLNKKIGLRYYIAELDSTRANLLNSYLTDSLENTQLLSQVVTALKTSIPQQASKELFNKWQQVRTYNTTLPDSLKIKVLGIDRDYNNTSSKISRDSAMVKNLAYYIKAYNLEGQKFYGLFGNFHVMQNRIGLNTVAPFASRLKTSNSKQLNAVKSIVTYHIDSEVYLPKNEQIPTPADEKLSLLNDNGPFILVKGIKDLKEVTQANTLSIFKLNSKQSPYASTQNLAGLKVRFFEQSLLPQNDTIPTTAFFQYAVLGRNSQALSPF